MTSEKTMVRDMGEAWAEHVRKNVTFDQLVDSIEKRRGNKMTKTQKSSAKRQFDALIRITCDMASVRSYVPDNWYDRIMAFVAKKEDKKEEEQPEQNHTLNLW